MTERPLSVYLGDSAAKTIGERGWQGQDIDLLLGASGGPKWLILGHLDRLLFGDYLLKGRQQKLKALGSSVGSWRHACLAQDDPIAAIDRFEDIYVNWSYSDKPDTQEISAASLAMLKHIFGATGARALRDHPLLHSYIVTARGRGLNSARNAPALVTGMGSAALANALNRRLLSAHFQRVLFCSADAPVLPFTDFQTAQVTVTESAVPRALHASGSIPFLLRGERDLPAAPKGHYWDGGIIDYHFDPSCLEREGLMLYPHFRSDLTTGWFDKFLPWRRHKKPKLDKLILLCPSRSFIGSLPGGKIPDRSDFTRLDAEERQAYWRICIDRSRELAEDFQRRISAPEPLEDVLPLPS